VGDDGFSKDKAELVPATSWVRNYMETETSGNYELPGTPPTSGDATLPEVPKFMNNYLKDARSKPKETKAGTPDDDDDDNGDVQAGAGVGDDDDSVSNIVRIDAHLLGPNFFSKKDERALIEAFVRTSPLLSKGKIRVSHVAQWKNPDRVVVEVQVLARNMKQHMRLKDFFSSAQFALTAQDEYRRQTGDTGTLLHFSRPSRATKTKQRNFHAPSALFGAIGAAIGCAFVCWLTSRQKLSPEARRIGAQRKNRSLQVASQDVQDDDDAF
jgi:hypothetical protein